MSQYEYSPGVRLIIGAVLAVGGLIMTVAGFRQLLLVEHPLQSSQMAGALMGILVLFPVCRSPCRPQREPVRK